jgi:hypothetical protein
MSSSDNCNHLSDGLLREAFSQLRRVFVNCVNAELIAESLIEREVVSRENWHASCQAGPQDDVERCRRLLALVDESAEDEESFRQLRLAVKSEPSYGWIVDELDDRYAILVQAQETFRQTRLAEAG